MKRIVAILLALLMLTPVAYADDGMTYRFTGGKGEIGDTVKVIASVENAPEIVAFETTLLYDPAVLKPKDKVQKMKMGGMMVYNTEFPTPVEGKGAIKIAVASTSKKSIMSGDLDLFNITFEIIGGSTDEKGSLIEVYYHLFSQNDADLSRVPSLTVAPCRIQVPVIKEEAPETNPPTETPDSDQPTQNPETNQPETNAPSDEKGDASVPTIGATPEAEESKKPTGDWYIVEDQAVLVEKDEEGKDVFHQFTTEYEKDEEGNITGVILYDEEEKEAGKLKVEEDEYGNITVLEQEMKEGGFSPWFLLPIGAAVIIAIAGVIFAIKNKKK